jgi:protein-disulfide isomerase
MQPRRPRRKRAAARRQRPWFPVAIVGIAAIVAVVVVVLLSNGGSSSSGARATPGPPHTAPQSDATGGLDTAPVTLVEYFRFDCSHCADFASQTEPSIEKDYVDTGKLRIVFRPLALEGDVLTASEAALCAGEQNRYWDYHDLVFANPLRFSKSDLKAYAKDLGLDANAFNSCLDSDKYKEQVVSETNEVLQNGVNSTPTFFVGKTSNMNKLTVPYPGETRISGAQSYDAFKTAIDAVLAAP